MVDGAIDERHDVLRALCGYCWWRYLHGNHEKKAGERKHDFLIIARYVIVGLF